MDAEEALARLTEDSTQIRAACLLDVDGTVLASTLTDPGAASRFAEAARALLAAADGVPHDAAAGPLAQLEVALRDGSVFVVCDEGRAVAAATRPQPTVGLVFYDLKTCLKAVGQDGGGDGRPRPAARARSQAGAGEDAGAGAA